ncbi:MAG: metallophosphoesterase [Candidatus Sumerlaeia bacterium]|nr:metallophosphoesterase [Candidatus Sumerlaeia bacterium]
MNHFLHVGDLHFSRFPNRLADWRGKRLLGLLNLALNRRKAFHLSLASILIAKLQEQLQQQSTHLLCSGDFSTTSLPQEFGDALHHFSPLRHSGATFMAVPGNHDRYNGFDFRRQTMLKSLVSPLSPFIQSWPFHFLTPDQTVCIIGIDATTRNGIGSHGFFRDADYLKSLLQKRLPNTVKQLIFLCHFPAESPTSLLHRDRGEQLRNSSSLLSILEQFPIPTLFCHGHFHQRWIWQSPRIPHLTYLNAGAPMLRLSQPGKTTKEADLGFFEFESNPTIQSIRLHRLKLSNTNMVWNFSDHPLPQNSQPIDLRSIALG